MQTLAASAGELVAADPRYWDCPSLNTAEHIANSLGKPIALPPHLADALMTDWATEHEQALLRWFARLTHQEYEQVHRDNTYTRRTISQRTLCSRSLLQLAALIGVGQMMSSWLLRLT